MRSAKFFLLLGFILTTSAVARADEIFVSANAEFHQQTAGDTRQFTFSTHFLYDLQTNQFVPGTMYVNIVDTLGGVPFTGFMPKFNFSGPTFTYLDSVTDEIQLLFALPGGTPAFPTPGSYPITDIMLLCVSNDCVQHFSGETFFPVAGDLSISAVPEPRSSSLFIFGALATIGVLATWSAMFRKIHG
jgi:hypothetical protein